MMFLTRTGDRHRLYLAQGAALGCEQLPHPARIALRRLGHQGRGDVLWIAPVLRLPLVAFDLGEVGRDRSP